MTFEKAGISSREANQVFAGCSALAWVRGTIGQPDTYRSGEFGCFHGGGTPLAVIISKPLLIQSNLGQLTSSSSVGMMGVEKRKIIVWLISGNQLFCRWTRRHRGASAVLRIYRVVRFSIVYYIYLIS